MPLTKIQSGSIEAGAIQTADLSANATIAFASSATFANSLTPKVSTVSIANSTFTVLDDTAVNVGGGYIVVTGSNFQDGATVLVDTTTASAVTYVNSTTLRVQVPAKSAATYNLYVVNPDGGTGIRVSGITYSSDPTWVTTSPLTGQVSEVAFSLNLSATEATSYSLAAGSSLPSGTTLASNGYFYGTVTVGATTTYSFDVVASDAENQTSNKTFGVTVVFGEAKYNAVTFLMQLDNVSQGANNSVFVDTSANNHAVSIFSGNPVEGSKSPYTTRTNAYSYYFPSNGNYLFGDNTQLAAGFAAGTTPFTIEYWVFPMTATTAHFSVGSGGGYGNAIQVGLHGDGKFKAGQGNGGGTNYELASSTTYSYGQWYHVAVTKDANRLMTIYVNGVSVASGTNSNGVTGSASRWVLNGLNDNNGLGNNGGKNYISNARIVMGSVVYTGNFTPSTSALTAVTNTKVLTAQTNKFEDTTGISTNVLNDKSGVSVEKFSPFTTAHETYSYNPSSNTNFSGSVYFNNNTSDALSIPGAAFPSGAFTAEAWVYLTRTPNGAIFCSRHTGGTIPILFGPSNGNVASLDGQYMQLALYDGSNWAGVVSTQKVDLGEWTHVAGVFDGSTTKIYINGVEGTSGTRSTWVSPNGNVIFIGRHWDTNNNNFFNGYIADARLTSGAKYTTTFTPPTAPPAATSNTTFLLQGTNCGLYDASMQNNILTYGGIGANTSVKKFSSASAYFNGSSQYFAIPTGSYPGSNGGFELGAGDWTIEFWLYVNSFGSGAGLIEWRTGNNNQPHLILGEPSGKKLVWRFGGNSLITSPTDLSAATWYHVALCKSGSSTKMFINGTQTSSTYSDTQTYTAEDSIVKIGTTWDNNYLNGNIDELRITKGFARYTANFTAPTEKFTDI